MRQPCRLINYGSEKLQLNKTKTQFENIAIVGLGGIGSQVIDYLFINDLSSTLNDAVQITKYLKRVTLVDFDTVEAKNLNNQQYTEVNIGQSKVFAQSMKLQSVLRQKNVKLQILNNKIQDVPDVLENTDLIIGCLDNVVTRQFMATRIKPDTLILDLGSEELQGTIRFYGWYFQEFNSDLFINENDKLIPLCQQVSGEENSHEETQRPFQQIQNQQIITHSDVNRYIVNKGFEYLAKVISLAEHRCQAHYDMIHISFNEIYFEQPILLRNEMLEGVIIDIQNRRILDWPRFNISHDLKQSQNNNSTQQNIFEVII